MTSSPSTIYLVTGANRGIGLGFVSTIAQTHPAAFIYAGVRNPSKATELEELSAKYPGRIAIVKCVSADVADNAALAAEIKARHGRVDTVIANAGISNSNEVVAKESPAQYEEHFRVNVVGPVVLFQAVFDLLKASPSPRFVPIGSEGASIGGFFVGVDFPSSAYAGSKAALNYVTRRIHFENKWLTAFPLSPGLVDTTMLKDSLTRDTQGVFDGFAKSGLAPITIYESAAACLPVIDNSTRESSGGEFLNEKGTKLPW